MSYISVQFGYNQCKLFNINCQVAPLLDAINAGAYTEMGKAVKKREEFFHKEINGFKKKELILQRQLEKLEKPKEEKKEPLESGRAMKNTSGRRLTKKEQDEIARHKKEEEERLKAEEEERLRKEEEARVLAEEEEKKKAAQKKGAKKPPTKAEKEAEVMTEGPPETEAQKIEREKSVIRDQLEELKKQIDQYQHKVKLCHINTKKIEEEEKAEKQLDLRTKTDDSKFLRNALEERADAILGPRKAYVLVKIRKNESDEDCSEDIVIDGACIRTPDEDIKWEIQQEELAAQAAKGGKKPAPGKKK